VIFRLAETTEATALGQQIDFFEGEKDAVCAVELGLNATCVQGGTRHAAVVAVEHAFTLHAGHGHDLDMLKEIATTMPHLRFADFWHGYVRFLCAEALLITPP